MSTAAKEPAPPYAELLTTSNFSFLRAGSHPEELVAAAVALGMTGLGLCDRNTFAGVVRAHVAVRDDLIRQAPNFRYVVGVRLAFADGTPDIIVYPTDRAAYGRLCQLLTRANSRGEKGAAHVTFALLSGTSLEEAEANLAPTTKSFPRKRGSPLRLVGGTDVNEDSRLSGNDSVVKPKTGEQEDDEPFIDFLDGQLFIVCPDESNWQRTERVAAFLAARAPDRVWIAAAMRFGGTDRARLNRIADLARRTNSRMLASNDVSYHEPARKIVQDVVTCIREHLTLAEAGRRLDRNAERHLKPAAEMARLFHDHPGAIAETQELLNRIGFNLDQLQYNYPEETISPGETAQQTLERLTWEGAAKRYPEGLAQHVVEGLKTELALIAKLKYAAYFLTVYDIVQYARHKRKILCQGRGSAANSMVCFCLEITEVDPTKAQLVFGRFLSTERNEPPDIDVDFEHERREEVMQYVYKKYGGKRTGLTANVISYRSKSAIREAAKVFGFSDDTIAAINQQHWGWGSTIGRKGIEGLGLDPDDPTMSQLFDVVRVLKSFPRHLSQHVGGFVITRDSLESLVPIGKTAMESRTIIEWNKDDIDALKILKVDILALGMLTCIRRAFELMHVHYGQDLTLRQVLDEEADEVEAKIPFDDRKSSRVYKMTHRADTIGVFQIESRAQMSMLPRLKPKQFYDLVIEVAIVRPGPIQGGMVHPYLKRRLGEEKAEYPGPELEAVLGRTLGVPLFQEQAMQIAIVGAGFTEGEADGLRHAMATWRRNGKIELFKKRFMDGMAARNYPQDFAERCFKQIEGFGEYGFPESHAASFALLVYVSCWLKCHYPDVFACALLNSQPMGFYAPAQIVRDAIEHGVEVRAADINLSDWWHLLEDGTPAAERVRIQHAEQRPDIWSTKAIRLGLGQVTGLKEDHANLLMARRGKGYDSVRDVWLRTGLPVTTLETLAEADAFGSLGLNRRDALWAVKGLMGTAGAEKLPLFAIGGGGRHEEPDADLPPMPPGEEVVHDYRALTLSLKGHPVGYIREALAARGVTRCCDLVSARHGSMVEAAGLVLVRQRPGTASGVIFSTLEDETGIANIIIWSKVFEANRKVVLGSRLMSVRGQLQREGLVTHIVARTFVDMTPVLTELADGHDFGDAVLARGDEGRSGPQPGRDAPEARRRELAQRQARAALPVGRNFH